MTFELPRDIIKLIARKLDIDTRRALGIYTSLEVPLGIRKKLLAVVYNKLNRHALFSFESGSGIFLLNTTTPTYCLYDIVEDSFTEYDLHMGDIIRTF